MAEPTHEELEMRRKLDGMLIQRLDGIESELKAMREVLVKSAQLEERMVRVSETGSRIEVQLNAATVRITQLESQLAVGKEKMGNTERALWAIISIVSAGIAAWIAKHS